MRPSEFSLDPGIANLVNDHREAERARLAGYRAQLDRPVPGGRGTSTEQTGGVQSWSVGDYFPWIVEVREDNERRYWVVSLAGRALVQSLSADEAHDLALEFKRLNVREVRRAVAIAIDREAALEELRTEKAQALKQADLRDRESNRQLRGDPEADSPLQLSEVLAERREERVRVDLIEALHDIAKQADHAARGMVNPSLVNNIAQAARNAIAKARQ